jgi:hypothetical protein
MESAKDFASRAFANSEAIETVSDNSEESSTYRSDILEIVSSRTAADSSRPLNTLRSGLIEIVRGNRTENRPHTRCIIIQSRLCLEFFFYTFVCNCCLIKRVRLCV